MTKKSPEPLKNKIWKIVTVALLLGASLIIFYHCPFRYFLGIPCPGCGMTRALLALLRLDIEGAFYYHPLFPAAILAAVYLALDYLEIFRLPHKVKTRILAAVCALFLITYVIRLAAGSPVVQLSWEDSFLKKLLAS